MRTKLPKDIRALGGSGLFRGCSERQLFRVQRFGTVVDVPRGRVLCNYDGRGDQLLVIISGEVLAAGSDGRPRSLGPGDWCAAFGDRRPPTSEAQAVATVTTTTLFVVSRRELGGLCDACPAVRDRLFPHTKTTRGPESPVTSARTLSPAT
jgi:CRP-like cAMP-binding protein